MNQNEAKNTPKGCFLSLFVVFVSSWTLFVSFILGQVDIPEIIVVFLVVAVFLSASTILQIKKGESNVR